MNPEYATFSFPLATKVHAVLPKLSAPPEGQYFYDGFSLGKTRAAELVQQVEGDRLLKINALRKDVLQATLDRQVADAEVNNMLGFNEALDAVLEILNAI